jgi:hypothetical protein
MVAIVTATTDNIQNICQNLVNANGSVSAAKTAATALVTAAGNVDSQASLWSYVLAMLTYESFTANPSYTNAYTYSDLGTY